MTSNPATARLRWLMVAVLLFDMGLTLAGQPSSYWQDPGTAQEDNPLVAWVMHRGPVLTMVSWVGFIVASFALVTFLPGRSGSITLLAFILGAFAASTGWVVERFHLGMPGLYVYSFVVAGSYILLMERQKPNNTPEPMTMAVTPRAISRISK